MENNLEVIAEKKDEIMDAIQETLTNLGLADDFMVDRVRFINRKEVPENCTVRREKVRENGRMVIRLVTVCKP